MKCFKIILLFIFFVVTGCSVYGYNDSLEIVSTEKTKSLNVENKTDDVLIANVTIYNNNYSSFLGIKYKKHNTYGSGFIYNSDESYYYVLTKK